MKGEVYKNLLHSSKTDLWATPQALFDELNEKYEFTLDPCANHENHKCDKYYTLEEDGLKQSWDNETVFMNPPYGRQVKNWIKKASEAKNSTVVCLLPARTDTKWFHEYIYNKSNVQIAFIKGRIKFGGSPHNAPFPSMLVVFNKGEQMNIYNIPDKTTLTELMPKKQDAAVARIKATIIEHLTRAAKKGDRAVDICFSGKAKDFLLNTELIEQELENKGYVVSSSILHNFLTLHISWR